MRPKLTEFQNDIARLFPDEVSETRKVRTVTIQVTDACNLRCTYCYQISKRSHLLDIDTAKAFMELLLTDQSTYINRDNTTGIILDLIGGEPFLAIEMMDELVGWLLMRMADTRHPWLHRFRVSISSNGTLYFDPKVQNFLRKYMQWLSLTISIDGNKELHDACRVYPDGSGSYDITVKAAIDWITRGSTIGSKMTLSPMNISHTCEAIKNLINLGYVSVMANCIYEEGWLPEHASILYLEMIKLTDWLEAEGKLDTIFISLFEELFFISGGVEYDKNWCGGTGDMIAVDYKGDIFPCLRYMESSLGTDALPVIIGTVAGGICETDEHRETAKCFQCISWQSQSSDECCRCPISRGCAWCSAYNYQHLGNVNKRATYICEMHKARALANVYFWVKYNAFMGIAEPAVNNVPREWAIPIIGETEWDQLNQLVESQ